MLLLLPVLHLAAAAVCIAAGTRAGRRSLAVAAVPLAVSFGWLVSQAGAVADGATTAQRTAWVPALDLSFDLRLDGFALFGALVVTGIGLLVVAYSASYFRHHDGSTRPDLPRLVGYLVAFAGSMLGLVLADGLLTLFVFWELTSITSFLLIGIDDRRPEARDAARRALLVTGAGGLALLGGLVVLGQATGDWRLSELDLAGGGVAIDVGLALLLVGAATKSAQFPTHFWLPGAMAAPTPVSAYLHSATMVKAGVILVARVAPLTEGVGWWRPVAVVLGGLTMLVGGIGALRQYDAKLLLAHGTVSQLGFLVVLMGFGDAETTYAGVAVFLGHALFKAALFLSVGVIDHQCHTRDLRRLGRLHRRLPAVAAVVVVAGASMAGLPPMLGFVAKEEALHALEYGAAPWGGIALGLVVAGSVLTVAYTVRLWWGLLGSWAPAGDAALDAHRPSVAFVAPGVALAVASLVGGLAAGPVGRWVATTAGSLDATAIGLDLYLWGGVNLALALSVVAIVGGLVLARVVVARDVSSDGGLGADGTLPMAVAARGERAFAATYDATLRGSKRITRVTQSGSLPAYVAIVLVVVVGALVVAAAADGGLGRGPRPLRWADSWLEVAVATVTVGFATAVVLARRRIEAALLLGAVGFGVAATFLVTGAPDLALTQVLVESLSIVLFVLVLRRLPAEFSPAPAWAPRWARAAVALTFGVVVAGFALSVSRSPGGPSVGEEMVATSLSEGGGRNVVNVILVDIRGFDTLGEITVVAVAAVGVVNLVAAARREQRAKRLEDAQELPS